MSPILLFAQVQALDPITPEDVLGMMERIPACEACAPAQPGHWETRPAARELAVAIAATVDGSLTGTARGDAALASVYAAWEGGNLRCARGDGGLAWGPYQLQHVPRWIACDPRSATARWYDLAKASLGWCADLALEERLAALASGTCGRAREKVAHRWAVSADIAIPPEAVAQE